MMAGRKIEQRKERSFAFRLGQPFFMQVPKPLAASLLTGAALFLVFASKIANTVSFGHFFLLICAFAAWFVGSRFAVLLGAFIVVIQILSDHATTLHDEPILMAMQFCSVLAVVLMLGVSRAALEIEWRFARTDPLTGALNRKAFFEAVANDKSKKGVAVLVFADADGLKRLNDRLGHEAGDKSLQDFAERVSRVVRKQDVFARIGGDEFVLFLRVRDVVAAEQLAYRLNGALNFAPLKRDQLKCSLGVLVLPSGSRSIDAELKRADGLMYHAKRERLGLMISFASESNAVEPVSTSRSAIFASQ